MAARTQSAETTQLPEQPLKIRIHDVMPRFNPKEDEISLFLMLFEPHAKIMNTPAENQVTGLIPLLPHDIVQLIAKELEEDAKKYEYVKILLLQRFKLSAEKFRQLFNKHQKSTEVCLPLAEVEINCELGHIKTKAAVVTNDPGRYVLGNKSAEWFKDKPFFNLERVNALLTRSQVKRSREEDRSKETEMEKLEELSFIEIDEDILPQADEEDMEIKRAPDFNKEFILQTDASDSGMGVILAQKDERDNEHPVLYLSKQFTETEEKSSPTEKKCAAIIFAVKKLQCYLDEHTKFLIMTDPNPLVGEFYLE
ncbi:Retrovirus-related Pol polyprotein from transposon 297, partial [Stegodyphus mimosarum]